MSRVQLAINVEDLDPAIEFYSKLFATGAGQGAARATPTSPSPNRRSSWSSSRRRRQGRHAEPLGVEVASTDEVVAAQDRLAATA